MTRGMIIHEYATSRFDFSFVHVTNSYSFEISLNDIFLLFLILFSSLLFTTWSIISSSLKIEKTQLITHQQEIFSIIFILMLPIFIDENYHAFKNILDTPMIC